MAQMLAQYFPKPEECITGIYELILNTIEHGILGIGSDEKTNLIQQGKCREDLARKLKHHEASQKKILVTVRKQNNACHLTIADEGEGFVWQDYSELTEPSRKPNGRGLWIAFNSAFDYLIFNERGNIVTCVSKPYKT